MLLPLRHTDCILKQFKVTSSIFSKTWQETMTRDRISVSRWLHLLSPIEGVEGKIPSALSRPACLSQGRRLVVNPFVLHENCRQAGGAHRARIRSRKVDQGHRGAAFPQVRCSEDSREAGCLCECIPLQARVHSLVSSLFKKFPEQKPIYHA